MCRLLETIKCENGRLFNLTYHTKRLNEARYELFGIKQHIDLDDFIKIPVECREGLFRCRLVYAASIQKVEFIPHHYRKIESLKLVVDNTVDYHLKYSDRSKLQSLFEKRGDCDDILIVKYNCITDSFTANPVFYDGEKWWTPDTPLLKGTQREHLLNEGKIHTCKISVEEVSSFKKVGLINALQNLEDMPVIPIKHLEF